MRPTATRATALILLASLGLSLSACADGRCGRGRGWDRPGDRHDHRYDCDRHRRGDHRY
jgi:hypothetical protein